MGFPSIPLITFWADTMAILSLVFFVAEPKCGTRTIHACVNMVSSAANYRFKILTNILQRQQWIIVRKWFGFHYIQACRENSAVGQGGD